MTHRISELMLERRLHLQHFLFMHSLPAFFPEQIKLDTTRPLRIADLGCANRYDTSLLLYQEAEPKLTAYGRSN